MPPPPIHTLPCHLQRTILPFLAMCSPAILKTCSYPPLIGSQSLITHTHTGAPPRTHLISDHSNNTLSLNALSESLWWLLILFFSLSESLYASARDLPLLSPLPCVCGFCLIGLIFVELLCDIHTAHMGPKKEEEENENKQNKKDKKQSDKRNNKIKRRCNLTTNLPSIR